MILKWIFMKWTTGGWAGLIWLRIVTNVGLFYSGNEASGSMKCGEFV
jgi:hypothetical protein